MTKEYVFNLYFNFKEGDTSRGRAWAEEKRQSALAYLKRLFENKARSSCVAKDENKKCLILRGYMNLNSPCTQRYARRLLGKYCSCKSSYFGDMASLCRFVHIDRDLAVTGGLPRGGGSHKKPKSFAGDPRFVIKILLDSIDKKDFEQRDKDSDIDKPESK